MADELKSLIACPLDRVWIPGRYGAPAAAENPGIKLERTTPVSLVLVSLFPTQEKQALTAIKKLGLKSFPEPGHATFNTQQQIYALGAGRYLIESDETDLCGKFEKALSAEIGSVTDLSSARTVMTVSGPYASTVLAKGIAVDFHIDRFPIGKVAQTSAHHMPVMIVRVAMEEFRLFAFSSYAESTLHWLETAAFNHGFERF